MIRFSTLEIRKNWKSTISFLAPIAKWTAVVVAFVLSTFVTMVLVLLLWVFYFPQSAWTTAQKYFLPEDLKISWQNMELINQKNSFWNRNIEWNTSNLIIAKKTPELFVGFHSIRFKFHIDISLQHNNWFEVDILDVQAQNKNFITLTKETEEPAEISFYQQGQSYLDILSYIHKFAKKAHFQLNVPELEIRSADTKNPPLLFNANLANEVSSLQSLHLKLSLQKQDLSVQIQAQADGSQIGTEQPVLSAQAEVLTPTWSLKSSIEARAPEDRIDIEMSPQFEILKSKKESVQQSKKQLKHAFHANSSLQLKLTETAAQLSMKPELYNLTGPIGAQKNILFTVKMPMENDLAWSREETVFKMQAPVDLFLIDKDMKRPFENACKCKLPEEFHTELNGKVWLESLLNQKTSKQKVLEADLKIESINNKLFSADIAAGISIFREDKVFSYEPSTNSKLIIHSFQGLREYLDAKNIMIPAPLSALDGTLTFVAGAPISQDIERVETKVEVDINLSSAHQNIKTKVNANLDLSKTLKFLNVYVDVLIESLQLELPPLDPILGVPPIAKDKRFLKKPKPAAKESKFKVFVSSRIRTQTPGALKLLSQYAKPYAPISLDVSVITDHTPVANFKLEPFTIEYLRRKIFVENIQVKLVEGKEENKSPLKGRLRLEQGGYKIFINFAGTTDSPSINLSSEPYLPEPDIISVLLYGRVGTELASNEASTAGNVNAAIADKAIGIFGLWAFAVTPIQSFSYNPITKIYTATVKLGTGLTVGVGTNWEQSTNLELRKQISSKWVLTASWAEAGEDKSNEKLVLRWERRF